MVNSCTTCGAKKASSYHVKKKVLLLCEKCAESMIKNKGVVEIRIHGRECHRFQVSIKDAQKLVKDLKGRKEKDGPKQSANIGDRDNDKERPPKD